MPKESLQALYNAASQSFNNLGTYNEFEQKMQDSNKRKLFYDVASKTFGNLGSYDQFEAKVTTTGSKIKPDEVFPEQGRFSLTAAPAKKEPGVSSNEYSQPIPGFIGREYLLTKTLSGKAMLKQYGWEIVEPEEPMSASDVAKAQNKLFLQNEIAKEKQKGLSERDAYRKVVKDVGGTPPNIVDLGMEQSITGAVFRIVDMDRDWETNLF